VSVTDGEPGIQAEGLPYIFERFYQDARKLNMLHGEWPRVGTGKKVVEATRRADLDRKRSQERNDLRFSYA